MAHDWARNPKYWLFRAVDQDFYELDVMVQPRRDKKAVTRFFKKVLKSNPIPPRVIVTDKLRSYNKPIKALFPQTDHRKHKRLNNRIENSHQPTRRREKQMIKFKKPERANSFLSDYRQMRNLFMVGRCNFKANEHRNKLAKDMIVWDEISLQERYAEFENLKI